MRRAVVFPLGWEGPPGQQRKGESKCEGQSRWRLEKPGEARALHCCGGRRGRPEEEASQAQGIGVKIKLFLEFGLVLKAVYL